MKNFYKKCIKNIFKNHRYYTFFTILLIAIVFVSYVGNILAGQSLASPNNPIDGTADNVSNVALAGSFEMDKEDNKDEDKEDEAEEDKEDDDSDKDDQSNEEDTSTGESEGDDGGQNPESPNIVIVRPEDADENTNKSKINEYFTTTIKDNEIVTKENYSFSIIQRDHGLEVKKTEVSLNRDLLKSFDGRVKLKEGKNNIKIKITYEDEEEKNFSVSRVYSVYYNSEGIVIYTSLKDGMRVTVSDLSFTAHAKKGDQDIPVEVEFAEEKLKEESRDLYRIELKEGENKVTISASDDYGNFEEKEFTINYIKHYDELTIVTDLKNYQNVRNSEFKFNAIARVEDRRVDLSATHNGSSIQGDKDGNYKIPLIEGSNFIVLKASDGENEISEEYEIMYEYRPQDDDDYVDPYKPIIDTTLKSGTVKSDWHTMFVRPKDYKKNRLPASNIKVQANGNLVPIEWADGDQISYNLPIVNGDNQILITVWDNNGNTAIEEYIIKGIIKEEGEVKGHVTMSLEATTIGLGNLIPPTRIEIRQGELVPYVLDRFLRDKGFTHGHTGTPENGYYLAYIEKAGIVKNPKIPADLEELILAEFPDEYYPEGYDPDSLGEFDFTTKSGWMFSVNGNFGNVGFTDQHLTDGDVVRIRFTLALGYDLGGAIDGKPAWGDW